MDEEPFFYVFGRADVPFYLFACNGQSRIVVSNKFKVRASVMDKLIERMSSDDIVNGKGEKA